MLEYAPVPRIVRRGIYKNNHVIARFLCYSMKKKSGQCTKLLKIMSTHENWVIGLRYRTDNEN